MMLSKKPFLFILPAFLLFCHAFSPVLSTKQRKQQLQALPEVELKIEGLVTTDGKPCKATVEIHSNHLLHRTIITIQTDSINGQFTTRLRAGDDYDVVVKSGRFPQQVLSVSTKNLDSTRVLPLFADFTSPVYDKKIEDLKKSTSARERVPASFNTETFRKRYGHVSKENLEYKVQIAAYRFFENFNYNNVMGLPNIIRKTGDDYITRFTMGNFKTFNEAYTLMQQARKCRLNEAFVVAFYNGKRMLPGELLGQKVLQ